MDGGVGKGPILNKIAIIVGGRKGSELHCAVQPA